MIIVVVMNAQTYRYKYAVRKKYYAQHIANNQAFKVIIFILWSIVDLYEV